MSFFGNNTSDGNYSEEKTEKANTVLADKILKEIDTKIEDSRQEKKVIQKRISPSRRKIANKIIDAPGMVGKLADYIDSQCRYPRPHLSIASALQSMSNIAGLQYEDVEFGIVPNLLTFCVAGSATGKEAIFQAQTEIQSMANLSPCTLGAIKSEQEIIRNVVDHQPALYLIDEVGILLGKIGNASKSGATYLEGVIGAIMSIYSKSGGRFQLGGDKAKEVIEVMDAKIAALIKKEDDNGKLSSQENDALHRFTQLRDDIVTGGIKRPFLSIMGFTTPSTFKDCINFDNATSGFIGRSLIFEEKDTNPRPRMGFQPLPMEPQLAQDIIAIGKTYHGKWRTRVEYRANRNKITTDPQARERLDVIINELWEYSEDQVSSTGLEAIPRRGFEMVLKVSMILAIGDGQVRTLDHVEWAYDLVKKDLEFKIKSVDDTETRHEKGIKALEKRIMYRLQSCESMTVGALCRAVRTKTNGHHDPIEGVKANVLSVLGGLELIGRVDWEKGARGVDKWFVVE